MERNLKSILITAKRTFKSFGRILLPLCNRIVKESKKYIKHYKKLQPYEKLFVIVIGGIVFLLLSKPLNRLIINSLEDSSEKSEAVKADDAEKSLKGLANQQPPPSQNPSKFGIIAKSKDALPQTQSDWDQAMKKILTQSQEKQKVFDTPQETPQEFANRLKIINDRIRRYEKVYRTDPSNEEAEQKLQTLYMLRATLLTLESKITKPK